ncbi:SIN3-HDAC complex-associated factor isoform X2 [Diorhabda carinulata]|uniref:SIN3-HDAC complex-associated factor isoform X2 n=1 Tax=Diorhabda carinulata TaxID=1163345 RepID=UPI00259FEF6B|nr:SIN3-HDAC complex-associated factor isoform X2 [Diorhabda carinulata]
MFSFHRPKVYRSTTGCCICKAKSSSSRFTDSKKYEEDFLECFKLATPRQGEICNACVLLVKRWKKLPAGSGRNWQHVVDARAGPGIKSMTKFKVKNRKLLEEKAEKLKKKQFDREDSPNLSDKSEEHDLQEVDYLCEDGPSNESSRTGSPGISDSEDVVMKTSRRYKGMPKRREAEARLSGFIDQHYWIKEEICCGVIFRGRYNEIMVDPAYLKPCLSRLNRCKLGSSNNKPENEQCDTTTSTKAFSDNSSDSGYDESSNPGPLAANNANFQKDEECSGGSKFHLQL